MKKKRIYKDYPPTDDIRSGCKVGWRTYATREEAEACAKAAHENAIVLACRGYDFGYQMPGSIRQLADDRFEVCIP